MEIKKGNRARAGRVSFKCTIPLASYRIIVNTDYTRSGGNEGRTAAPLIANWLRYRNNTGRARYLAILIAPSSLRLFFFSVRSLFRFSCHARARACVSLSSVFKRTCTLFSLTPPPPPSFLISSPSRASFAYLPFFPLSPLFSSLSSPALHPSRSFFNSIIYLQSPFPTFLCSGPFVENVVIQFILLPRFYPFFLFLSSFSFFFFCTHPTAAFLPFLHFDSFLFRPVRSLLIDGLEIFAVSCDLSGLTVFGGRSLSLFIIDGGKVWLSWVELSWTFTRKHKIVICWFSW